MYLEGIQQGSLFLAQLLKHKSRGKVPNTKLKALRLIRRGEALRDGRANTAPVQTLLPPLKSWSSFLFHITEPWHLLWPKSPPTAQNWSQQQQLHVAVIPPAQSHPHGSEGFSSPPGKLRAYPHPGEVTDGQTHLSISGACGTFTSAGTFSGTLIITTEWPALQGTPWLCCPYICIISHNQSCRKHQGLQSNQIKNKKKIKIKHYFPCFVFSEIACLLLVKGRLVTTAV